MKTYIISEAFKDLHRNKLNESANREDLMNKLDDIYDKFYSLHRVDEIEKILTKHHASDDDSDPNEGYMKTMSNQDLQNAINEAVSLISIDLAVLIKKICDCVVDNIDEVFGCVPIDDGFEVVTAFQSFCFELEKVNLQDDEIQISNDDFSDYM